MKKAILKHFVIFTGKQLCRGLFLTKLKVIKRVTSSKRDSNTDISGEYCEIYKKTYFEGH